MAKWKEGEDKEPKEKAQPEKEKEKEIPMVQVRSKGRINRTLEYLALAYQARYLEGDRPTRVTRWVYSPTHRPELSNVVGRKVDGWKECFVEELPESKETLGLKPGEVIRLGDLILMWTTPENRAQLRRELAEKAKEQTKRVTEQHYENIRAVAAPGMRAEHAVTPRGTATIEEREFVLDSRKLQEAAEAQRREEREQEE